MFLNLKKLLKKNQKIYSVLRVFKLRNDEVYRSAFCNIGADPTYVKIVKTCPDSLGKAPVCIFKGFPNAGLGAFIRHCCNHLYYCDNLGFYPYFEWDNSCYKDDIINTTNNQFEYYFLQPFGLSAEDLNTHVLVNPLGLSIKYARNLTMNVFDYHISGEYIKTMGKLVSKYLIFNDQTKKLVDDKTKELSIDSSFLGVHIRGTDFKRNYKDHPVYVEPKDYFQIVDNALEKYNFQKIFLATDDSEYLTEFVDYYGSQMVSYFKDSARATGNLGVHYINNKPYMAGIEVLTDMIVLSRCGGIVSGLSQVPICARIFKSSREENYVCDVTIDKGIRKKGMTVGQDKEAKMKAAEIRNEYGKNNSK